MVFSNTVFLFLVLPIVLILYYSPLCKTIKKECLAAFVLTCFLCMGRADICSAHAFVYLYKLDSG